jgi:hypothetical protein
MSRPFFSRRDFLKFSSAALLALLTPGFEPRKVLAATQLQGRVTVYRLKIHDGPAFSAARLGDYDRDAVVEILDQVEGGVASDYNRLWYRVGDGAYVYSGYVQPVQTSPNQTVSDLPGTVALGEVTIPYVSAVYGVGSALVPGQRLYYSTTHWLTGVVAAEGSGTAWYCCFDPLYRSTYYIPQTAVRLLEPGDLAPLGSQVPDEAKHIEIYLKEQKLTAFEYNQPVFSTRIASGHTATPTPTGTFRTFHKRPTYHMVGGFDEASTFDLPGVPWDSYITDAGVALHGTYWHNDFGTPHSHGCVNISPEAARWIYRWTLPTVPLDEYFLLLPGCGTQVLVLPSALSEPPADPGNRIK